MESGTKPISDERAVEVGQLGQPGPANVSPASVGYYEPDKVADLAKHGRLYIMADGISGGTFGQIAGRYAIQKILHEFYSNDSLDPKTRLLDLIQRLNREIFERNSQQPERRPMATTLTAALIHQNKLLMANVGDSRAYVVWGQDIERVDWDAETPPPAEPDNAPVLLLPARSRTPTETKIKQVNPNSHQQRLPAALGLEKNVNVQSFTRRLFPADIVVICSGGLAGYVTEKEIARAVSRYAPDEAVPRLIALAGERGNRDSVAVSVTRVLSSAVALRPPKAMPLPAAPQWSDLENEAAKPAKPLATDTQKSMQSPPKAAPAPASTVTQPLPSPKPEPKADPQTPPRYIQHQRRRRWWPGCLAGILGVLLLCAIPVLAWQYLIPAETLASIPYLSDIEAAITGDAASPEIDLPAEEPAIDTAATDVAQAATVTPLPAQTSSPADAATPEATASPQVTLVTENNSPVATPESTFNSPVSTPTPRLSPTPESLPTRPPSPTSLPTIELPAGCENRGRFRRDVTIPDGTQFAPGEAFEKIWLISNADTCPWGPGYSVRHIGGDLMGASPEVPLVDVVAPDTEGELTVPMIAPATAGQYRGEWQLHDLNGEAFGPVMYLEIEVTGSQAAVSGPDANVLYDFIANANQASWSAAGESYAVQDSEISEALELPFPQGLVAKGEALLRGNVQSQGDILLTYPHFETGAIEGNYAIDTPLEPTDTLVLELGFPKLSILSDDGVTFEVAFTPLGGSEQIIVSKTVPYRDSPVSEAVPLTVVQSGQTGTMTLRVLGGDSLNQDWATWVKAQLVRP